MNVKLVLEYEGTHYHGWQAQAQAATPTVESVLRKAIQSLTGESPVLVAAGRTDAGVHALGQVVNFKLEREFPIEQLPGALNARMPHDIAVRTARQVDETFNARYSARLRRYAYRIRQGLPKDAYQRQYAWGLHEVLDLSAMQAAASRLQGTHDFAAFGRSPRPGGHTIRRVQGLTVEAVGDWITIAIAADAFLYGMVRRIAGALVDIGLRRRAPEWIDSLLAGSAVALRLAPAHGLVQVGVDY